MNDILRIVSVGLFHIWGLTALVAQPSSNIEKYLLEGNKLFENGDFEGALVKYKQLIVHQPSNIYVLEQISRADEEILYSKIMEDLDLETNTKLYISQYSDSGKYILNVKTALGQLYLAEAYKEYQRKDLEALELRYVDYLTLLGTERSTEMKKWLYLLCHEKAKIFMKEKEWGQAKDFYEKSLKYANTENEFANAQEGISKALKKKN